MVARSHPAVTAAAVEVLRSGGTAVDAMLTALPLQQVLEPQLSTIAGGFGMLHWDAASGTGNYLNANPDHPTGGSTLVGGSPDTSGERVAVPGTVAGMRAAARRFGTRPWKSYFAPAIAAAERVSRCTASWPVPWPQRSRASPFTSRAGNVTCRTAFCRGGPEVPPATARGDAGRISEADGVEWFQYGAFAEHFATAVHGTGGTMTTADLAGYEPRWTDPLRFSYAGQDVLAPPPPDTGGLYCAFALGVLERTGIYRRGPWQESPSALAMIARPRRRPKTWSAVTAQILGHGTYRSTCYSRPTHWS